MVLKIPFHPNFYLSFALEIPYACTINKSTMGWHTNAKHRRVAKLVTLTAVLHVVAFFLYVAAWDSGL